MKIFYAFNYYQEEGGENRWFMSEPNLMKDGGHEVSIYDRHNNDLKNWPWWKKVGLIGSTTWSFRTYKEIKEAAIRERPDVGHIYNFQPLLTPAAHCAFHDLGIPVVQTLYNYRLLCPVGTLSIDSVPCERCVGKFALPGIVRKCYQESSIKTAAVALSNQVHQVIGTWDEAVTTYIVPTRFMRKKLIHGGFPESKVVVKPNWHDPDLGVRASHEDYYLYIGRLSEEKGIRSILSAWSSPGMPALKFIGQGDFESTIRNAIGEGGNEIELLGHLSHKKVIEVLKKAKALIVASTWYEAFPHVLLEAFACGVPVIASRIGTIADIVKEGENGILFEPGNGADLRERVLELERDAELGIRLGLRGRNCYELNYTGAIAKGLLEKIYQEAINRKSEISKD